MKKIYVIVKNPFERVGRIVEVENTLKALQAGRTTLTPSKRNWGLTYRLHERGGVDQMTLEETIKKHEHDAYTYALLESFEPEGSQLKDHWRQSKEKETDYLNWLTALKWFRDNNKNLVRRQSVINAFDGEIKIAGEDNVNAVERFINSVLDKIDNLPPVMPEMPNRSTGHWIKDELGTVICSECRRPRRDHRSDHIAFCNSCGAEMKGE